MVEKCEMIYELLPFFSRLTKLKFICMEQAMIENLLEGFGLLHELENA